jgi:hypothetical protein
MSHILNIDISDKICKNKKVKIENNIFTLINENPILTKLSNITFTVKWQVIDKTNLLNYYTDVDGIIGEKALQEHTKLLYHNIIRIINIDKEHINFTVSTKCMNIRSML